MADKYTMEIVLSEQKEELARLNRKKFVARKEESLVDLDSELAQVVIGVRRSGKSTLCYNMLRKSKKNFAYVNFDDERLSDIKGQDLAIMLEVLYKIYGDFEYLFIDEIQNITEWYLFVNRLLRQGMHILLTGSNAKLLSGELATHLTGRHHSIELYPFSFAEYCDFKGIDTTMLTTKNIAFRQAAFEEYLRGGGFPALLTEKNSSAYINDLVTSVLKRDIEQRHSLRYPAVFEKLAMHLLNTAPCKLNYKELQEVFGVKSQHTVDNYVNFLKQAYLVVGLHKYSAKSKLRVHAEKVYPVDVALLDKRPDAFVGENLGWRLESIVYLELLRRYRPLQHDIYYFATESSETDFLVCLGNHAVMAVQVSYDISNPKTRRREINGLLHVAGKTNCKKLLLITNYERADITEDSHEIAIRPAYEWLLAGE